MAIGFKIHPRTRTVDPATVEKFKGLVVANISDSMNRMSHGGARIRPLHAQQIGLAGVVLNGAVRDYGWIRMNAFPVFAAGITHRGPYKNGPGEVNATIALDGMVIEPGDLIVGDDDGVVCVPFDQTEAVFAAADKKQQGEAKTMAAIQAGTVDRSWVERALAEAGCEGI